MSTRTAKMPRRRQISWTGRRWPIDRNALVLTCSAKYGYGYVFGGGVFSLGERKMPRRTRRQNRPHAVPHLPPAPLTKEANDHESNAVTNLGIDPGGDCCRHHDRRHGGFFDADRAHRSTESRGERGHTMNFAREQDRSFPSVEVRTTRRFFSWAVNILKARVDTATTT